MIDYVAIRRIQQPEIGVLCKKEFKRAVRTLCGILDPVAAEPKNVCRMQIFLLALDISAVLNGEEKNKQLQHYK